MALLFTACGIQYICLLGREASPETWRSLVLQCLGLGGKSHCQKNGLPTAWPCGDFLTAPQARFITEQTGAVSVQDNVEYFKVGMAEVALMLNEVETLRNLLIQTPSKECGGLQQCVPLLFGFVKSEKGRNLNCHQLSFLTQALKRAPEKCKLHLLRNLDLFQAVSHRKLRCAVEGCLAVVPVCV